MKKVLLLIATAILALSGCREKVEPVYVDSLGNFNDATAKFYGDFYGNGTHNYFLTLFSGYMDDNYELLGAGRYVSFELNVPASPALGIPAGTYTPQKNERYPEYTYLKGYRGGLDENLGIISGSYVFTYEGSSDVPSVMMITDEYFYVVVFNYNSSVNAANITGTIPLDILGFTKEDFSSVKELWFGTTEEIKDGLSYNIPSRDCRVYRFTRTKPDAIGQVEKVDSEQITIESQGNQFIVYSQLPIRRVSCYDLAGRRMSLKNEDSYQTTLPIPTKKGVVIVSVTLANGKTYNKKLKL